MFNKSVGGGWAEGGGGPSNSSEGVGRAHSSSVAQWGSGAQSQGCGARPNTHSASPYSPSSLGMQGPERAWQASCSTIN